MQLGAGHTSGDIVAWVPDAEVMFSGDLIEYHSACYCGDAHLREWPMTLNEIRAFNPKAIAPGRGDALKGIATGRDAIAMTRDFVTTLYGAAETAVARGRNLKETMAAAPRGDGSEVFEIRDLRALPAVQRVPRLRRGVRDRRSRDLDCRAGPANVGRPARRMTMNINTSPDAGQPQNRSVSRRATCPASATASRPRRCPARCRSAATRRSGAPTAFMPSSCPARRSPRRAAATSASWLYRIRPSVRHCGRFAKVDAGLWRTAPCTEHEMPIAPMRWDPTPIPASRLTFLQGVRTMTTAGDAGTPAGMARACLFRHQIDGGRVFLQCRRRNDVRAAAGQSALRHRVRRIDVEPGEIAVIPRGVKFRVELHRRPGARLSLRKLRRRLHAARARADRRQLPRQCARFPHAGGGLRGPRHADANCIVKWGGALCATRLPHSPIDVVAWHGNYAPYKYDLRTLLAGRADRLRSSRSVDLHGADVAVGDAGHRQHRFRDLPRALDGGRKHLPPAVVPHEHHVGVHGADLRRL